MKLKEIVNHKERIYQGNFISMERWEVRLPDNSPAIREIVVPKHAVAVVPVDADGQLHLVKHARIAVDAVLLEIPAGVIDEGEAPEVTARRELVEEIGLFPSKLIKLITYYHAEGYSTGLITLFLGLDLQPQPAQIRDETEFLEHHTIPFDQALSWVEAGKFRDSKSLLGITLSRKHLVVAPKA